MQDLRVTVYDGKHHPVDSKEVAFVSAGRKAFLDALGKARADRARADRQRRRRRAGAEDGRHHGRALRASRPHQGLGRAAPRHRADPRAGAALGAGALPGAAEVAHRRATAPTRWSSATTSPRRRRCSSASPRRTSPPRTRTTRSRRARRIVDEDSPARRLIRRPLQQQIQQVGVVGTRSFGADGCGQLLAHSMRSGACLTRARASTRDVVVGRRAGLRGFVGARRASPSSARYRAGAAAP